MDVTETGIGASGHYSVGDEGFLGFGDVQGGIDCLTEEIGVANLVIGGDDGHGNVAFVVGHDMGGGINEASGGVTFTGLGKDIVIGNTDIGFFDGGD